MASDAWLRATTPASPARARRQASAFEFHWGIPPPAAAPRTTALIAAVLPYSAALGPRRLQMQVGAGVGVDFHADGDLDNTGRFPGHGLSPSRWNSNDGWNSKNVSRLARQIGRDHVDLLFVKGDRDLDHGAHPAPAPHPGAKVDQSLLEIFRPLPGQPRALALAGEIRLVTTVAMARRQEAGDLSGIDGDLAFGGERGRRWQRCVVGAKIANVVVGQVLDDRLHDPRLAAAVAHEHQLVLGEDIRLASQ